MSPLDVWGSGSPALVALAMTVALFAHRLVELYLGGGYVCPHCGSRRDGGHADDCPWER